MYAQYLDVLMAKNSSMTSKRGIFIKENAYNWSTCRVRNGGVLSPKQDIYISPHPAMLKDHHGRGVE